MLQVGFVNDISQSNHNLGYTKRLLRYRFTNGHLWLTTIEYHPIPSLFVDIPPSTKVYPYYQPILACCYFFILFWLEDLLSCLKKKFKMKFKDCNNLASICIFDCCTSKCRHLYALAHNACKSIETSMLPASWTISSFYHFHSIPEFTCWHTLQVGEPGMGGGCGV
jgi:hypothetical protein